MEMDTTEILNTFNDIFFNVMKVDKSKLSDTYMDDDFFGPKINFAPRDLLFMFFEIEKRFNIIIPKDDIINDKFNSINNILNIIYTTKQIS